MNKKEAKHAVKVARRQWVRPLVYGGWGHLIALVVSLTIIGLGLALTGGISMVVHAAFFAHMTVALLVNALLYWPEISAGMREVDAMKLKARSAR